MQKEKLAAIGLTVIIVGALSAFLFVTYGDEILKNLFGEEDTAFTIWKDSTLHFYCFNI